MTGQFWLGRIWEPHVWEEGDRVRVRLSGECRATIVYHEAREQEQEEFDCSGCIEQEGHDPAEDGAVGVVVERDDYAGWPESRLNLPEVVSMMAHRYMVEFDRAIFVACIPYPQGCQFFAAIELEPE